MIITNLSLHGIDSTLLNGSIYWTPSSSYCHCRNSSVFYHFLPGLHQWWTVLVSYLLVHLLPFSMVTGVSLQKSNPIHTPLCKIKCIPTAFRINSKSTYVWPLATSLLPHPIPTFPESSHMQLCERHTLSWMGHIPSLLFQHFSLCPEDPSPASI